MKIIDFVMDNISDLKDLENDWESDLRELGILDEVKPLYEEYDDVSGNIILSYIVLAYDNKSTYLNTHKERFSEKRRILKILTKQHGMDQDVIDEIVENKNEMVNRITDWYLDFQKDWRWNNIIRCFEFHATAVAAKAKGDAKSTIEIGKLLDEGLRQRREGEKLIDEIQKDFANLDSVLEQEKKEKITTGDFMSFENWMANKHGR